ncbi:MAG TPA: S9 family peptidase [Terriglobales bacterium]|nr:S9 family peptidase [Terriglobales bacterium]
MRPCILVFLLSCLSLAQSRRPFTFEDMMALQRVGEPQVSPDAHWVAFSAVKVDLKANTRTPHLWVVPLAGGDAKQLTSGISGEDRPRWSPDSKQLAYISSQGGSSQVWVVDFDAAGGNLTGEPRRVTSISTEAEGELWSPDGQNILFVSSVYPECRDDACNKARVEEKARSKVKATVFNRLFYRHWSSYTGGKRNHLFVVPAGGGVARDLTPGDHDVPPFQMGGSDLYAFSPDSKEVAFTSNISEVEATSTNNDLFVVPVDGGTPRKITDNPASDSTPRYSPDGKYIAYLAQVRPGYESDRFRLMLYDRAAGSHRGLTENFDRWVGGFVWAPDSSRIYFVAEDKGEQPIYQVGVNGGEVRRLERGTNDDLAITSDGKALLFTRMSVRAPNEIYVVELANNTRVGAARQLTHLNDAALSQVEMTPLQSFWFTGSEKSRVQGFLLRPPNFDAHKKYPVKFLIHGGPQGAWDDAWSYRWNPELFAADGYIVVMINFHGSTGYGQKFIDAINGDWGGRPYVDLMRGLDYVERTYPFVDKDRECALGASYGGYMINWILGHTTRFKCLVSHDSTFNTESAYGTTEELWFPEWEFKGTPWTNRAMYRRWSPHLFAINFKTPTLVVHGQLDYRLDVSEGFQLFTTLQRLGVPSKMLYFPDEGHWVLKPQNSQLWYRTVNQWVDTWVKK